MPADPSPDASERTDKGLRLIASGMYSYGPHYGGWMRWAAREILKSRAALQSEPSADAREQADYRVHLEILSRQARRLLKCPAEVRTEVAEDLRRVLASYGYFGDADAIRARRPDVCPKGDENE